MEEMSEEKRLNLSKQCVAMDLLLSMKNLEYITDMEELGFDEEYSYISAKINGRDSGILIVADMYPCNYNKLVESNWENLVNLAKQLFDCEKMDVYIVGAGLINKHVPEEERGIFKIGAKYAVSYGYFYLISTPSNDNYGLVDTNPLKLSMVSDEYWWLENIKSKFGDIIDCKRKGSHTCKEYSEKPLDDWKIIVSLIDNMPCPFTFCYDICMDPYALDTNNAIEKNPVFFELIADKNNDNLEEVVPVIKEEDFSKEEKLKILDEKFFKQTCEYMKAYSVPSDKESLTANANFCKIVSGFIHNKYDTFGILMIYDFITDVLSGRIPKIAVSVPKERRFIMARNLLDKEYITIYNNDLDEEEKSLFAFCIVYSFFVYGVNEETQEMVQAIYEFTSAERILATYNFHKKEFPNEYEIKKYSDSTKDDYGLSSNNPIEVTTVSQAYAYLEKIVTNDNKKIIYERAGSVSNDSGIIIDKYEIFVKTFMGKKKIADFYITPYGNEISRKAPKGFKC